MPEILQPMHHVRHISITLQIVHLFANRVGLSPCTLGTWRFCPQSPPPPSPSAHPHEHRDAPLLPSSPHSSYFAASAGSLPACCGCWSPSDPSPLSRCWSPGDGGGGVPSPPKALGFKAVSSDLSAPASSSVFLFLSAAFTIISRLSRVVFGVWCIMDVFSVTPQQP